MTTESEYFDNQTTNSTVLNPQPNNVMVNSLERKTGRQLHTIFMKRKQKLYGVLGLTKIQDEEGTSAFLYGKDKQRDPNSFMTSLYPNLYTDHEMNKRAFMHNMDAQRREIEDGERQIEKIKRQSSAGVGIVAVNDSRFNDQLKETQLDLLA